jgi:cytochrome b561
MLRNTQVGWGWPSRAFHWTVAVLVVALFTQGLLMDQFPREARGYQIWLHAAVGSSLLAIMVARFVWFLMNRVPDDPPGTSRLQSKAAHLVHWALYGLIFLTMMAGWLLAGTLRTPVDVQMFGVFTLPQLASGRSLHELFEETHEIAGYLLIALAGLHAAAALWHHYVLRDDVLVRMLGRRPSGEVSRSLERTQTV